VCFSRGASRRLKNGRITISDMLNNPGLVPSISGEPLSHADIRGAFEGSTLYPRRLYWNFVNSERIRLKFFGDVPVAVLSHPTKSHAVVLRFHSELTEFPYNRLGYSRTLKSVSDISVGQRLHGKGRDPARIVQHVRNSNSTVFQPSGGSS
jgi:hypothetical protein